MPFSKSPVAYQRGFTLIELAIVLAIVGIVMAGIWVAASSVTKRNREEKASQYVLQIVQNIRKLYANQPTNAGIDVANMIAAGAVPAEIVNSPTTAINPWRGAVAITRVGTMQFSVGYNSVPQSSCVALMTTTTSNAYEIGLVSIRGYGATYTSASMPIDTAEAIAACNNTTSLGNVVIWTYNLRN